jgi:hypothetical protein
MLTLNGADNTQHADGDFAGDDDHRHPGSEVAEADQSDERRRDEELICQRIEKLAQCRHCILPASDVAVELVGERSYREQGCRQQIAMRNLDEEHGNENRNEQDAGNGDGVGGVHRVTAVV